MKNDLPTFSSSQFRWHKSGGHAGLRELGLSNFPRGGFRIRSDATRQVRTFEYDHQANEENEFFDGEAMAFIARGNVRVQLSVDF